MSIRVIDLVLGPPMIQYQPHEINQVGYWQWGLTLSPAPLGHIDFRQVVGLAIFQIGRQIESYIMIFLPGQSRPVHIKASTISFEQFPWLCGIYPPTPRGYLTVDRGTAQFLKTKQLALLEHQLVDMSLAFASFLQTTSVQPVSSIPPQPVTATTQAMAPPSTFYFDRVKSATVWESAPF